MFKSRIFTIGKTKEPWLLDALSEYTKRLQSTIEITWVLAKDLDHLETLLSSEKSYIALSPEGKLLSSELFSRIIQTFLEKERSKVDFVIGGAEGLSTKIKSGAKMLLSFSPLTFTHQITRLLLMEQLYRAFEIQRGSSYHK